MKSNNNAVIPEAREALDKFKMEAASEVGVDLKQGYNGHLTSREAGSVGGQMVNIMKPVRTAIYQRASRTSMGHFQTITYAATITA